MGQIVRDDAADNSGGGEEGVEGISGGTTCKADESPGLCLTRLDGRMTGRDDRMTGCPSTHLSPGVEGTGPGILLTAPSTAAVPVDLLTYLLGRTHPHYIVDRWLINWPGSFTFLHNYIQGIAGGLMSDVNRDGQIQLEQIPAEP